MLSDSLLAASLALAAAAAPAVETWAFQPGDDAFAAEALVDLRPLNETVAGEHGFVTTTKGGDDFALGDGKVARFWALNVGQGPDKPEDVPHFARWLAKRGVNVVRMHVQLSPDMKAHPDAKVGDANTDTIDRVWRLVAEMKKQGIYSIISPYWAGPVGKIPASWGVPTTGDRQQEAWGVLFFEPALQAGFRSWLKALYAQPNPYTGVPLAKEPAIAVIQIQNEDSLLFWTTMHLLNEKGPLYDELRTGFATWAAKKHGSLDQAKAAWQGESVDGDDLPNAMLGFYPMWEIANPPGGPGRQERNADQLRYWTETMRGFDAAIAKYLRDDLGCKQLVNAGNWRTADTVKLMDAERWSYCANEVIATNKYMSAVHVGPNCGWAIEPGDHFTNLSCTRDPRSLPTNVKQVVGHPFMITESSWVLPNAYLSEGPALVAAYSGLSGLGTYYWFADGAREWERPVVDWAPKQYKWMLAHPMGVGQFPAAAWMFRHGYVKRGDVAVHEERTDDDIFHTRTPLIAEEAAFDPNRDADKIPSRSAVKTGADPLAFCVGRVEVVYGDKADPAKNKVVDFAKYVDNARKTVASDTGELKLDWGRGVFTCDAPKAKVAAGFLGQVGKVALGDVTVTCANDYATIMVVSLDDQPTATSGKLLVQIGTTTRPTGWQDHHETFTEDKATIDGERVDAVGAPPWAVEKASGTVTIANAKLASATILDANGMATGEAQAQAAGGTFTLTLPPDALYVVVQAKGGGDAKAKPDAKKPADAKRTTSPQR